MLEERLLRLLDSEQLSSSKFADAIGVQRSSVSHILSGRNKPSFDFIQKTLKAFPYLRAEWLILGEGKMFDTDEISGGGNLFEQNYSETRVKEGPGHAENQADSELSDESADTHDIQVETAEAVQNVEDAKSPSNAVSSDKPEPQAISDAVATRKIRRVVVLYDDNTFDSYEQDS